MRSRLRSGSGFTWVWPRCSNIMVLVKPASVVRVAPSRLPALLALTLKVWKAVSRSLS